MNNVKLLNLMIWLMLSNRVLNKEIPSKVEVEVAFLKQMIIREVYTAWNVSKISYSLNEYDPWMPILDDNLFWPGFEKETESKNLGK